MSHQEYCARLDEDQLDSLIEHAKARIESLKSEGWVSVWVVSDYCNRAWFPLDQRPAAIAKMLELAAKDTSGDVEFSVLRDRMRPSEAAELFDKP